MKKSDFFNLLIEELELDENTIDENTVFESLSNYDSMSVMILIALIDSHFNKKLSSTVFKNINTLGDLMNEIGIDNFEA